MDKNDLLSNLQGQKYTNEGYVVNVENPQFLTIKKNIILKNDITSGRRKDIQPNTIFINRPKQQAEKPRVIQVKEVDMTDFAEYKEFEKAKRVDLQIQNRLNERFVNQIATSYAPQPKTLAELKALQTSRPELQKELDALEEYARTHNLSKEEKQKLKEQIYKNNYQKWKDGVKNVSTGKANEEAEKPEDRNPFDVNVREPPKKTQTLKKLQR